MQLHQNEASPIAEGDVRDANVEAACPVQDAQEPLPAAECDNDDFGLMNCIRMLLAVGVKVFIMVRTVLV